MVFVYPSFLWALAVILIPIIIHLFNFRRYKKVYFTNVKFLKALQQESKSKSRLRELLVLLARCLAIASLVLAFCQPLIPEAEKKAVPAGANAISVYIDNSFSMENVGKQGPLFEVAKTRAKELVKAFGNGDRFQVITNDFEGRHQRLLSQEDALNAIESIKISSAVRLLSDVVKRQNDFLGSSRPGNKMIYLISDAQRSTFDLENVKPDTLVQTTVIPLTANEVNNVFVDSCWFEAPLQQKGFIQKLHATIINKGTSPIDAGSARLFLNKQQVAIASFSVEADSKNEVLFTFECKQAGFNLGSVKIEDYPVTFDDELYFAFNSKLKINVCLVNGKGQAPENAFAALFKSDSLFGLSVFPEQMTDYNAFKNSDVLVLNQLSDLSSGLLSELQKFSEKGGALVLIPSDNANLVSYNTALVALKLPSLGAVDSVSIKTEQINLASGFYNGVFEKNDDRLNLPVINKHYKLIKNNRIDFDPLLSLQNGEVFFGVSRVNNASVYLFSAALNDKNSNFNKHALFVPTFYQLCFSSLKAAPLFYPVSANVMIQLKNDPGLRDQPPHIKKLNSETDIIPEARAVNNGLYLYTQRQVPEPGYYEVIRNKDTLLPLSFNYSRKESDLRFYELAALEKIISSKDSRFLRLIEDTGAGISKQILQNAEGQKLWKLFIILALLFIGIEVILLRLLK